MADTVINSPARNEDSSALGWVVSLIVVLAVIVAGFVWVRSDAGVPNTGSGTNINIETPSMDTGAGTPAQ
jgi:hypothetical protein